MQKNKHALKNTVLLLIIFFCSCHRGSSSHDNISSDSIIVASGEALFNQYCSGCHNIQQNGIGPKLAGITAAVSMTWLRHFIADPQEVISSGDERASQLFRKYKTVMPSFATLKENDVDALIAFLHVHRSPADTEKDSNKGLTDPIPEPVVFGGLVVHLKEAAQFPVTSGNGKMPLARITKLDFEPESGSLFVDDLNGRLYKMKEGKPLLYMDMLKLKPRFICQPGLATGLGSFAFHPGFAKNGLLYTTHTEPPRTVNAEFGFDDPIKATVQWVLTEWKAGDVSADHFAGNRRELL
ncbi:MAG TPA: cytochrome c, partial [Agriterribacter sp.]|nr:cytochrome c [Agriterribacter sp.]